MASRAANLALVDPIKPRNTLSPVHPEIWSLRPWKRRCVLPGINNWSDSSKGAFSDDGHLIAFGSRDSTIVIYDARKAKLWARLGAPQQEPIVGEDFYSVGAVTFSPDRKTLASANRKGIFLWNLQSKRLILSRPILERANIRVEVNGRLVRPLGSAWLGALQFSPDGQTLAMAGSSVVLFDLAAQRVRRTLRLDAGDGGANVLIFSPDGRQLLSVGYWNASAGAYDQIALFDTRSGRALWRWDNQSKVPEEYDTSHFYTRAAFSSDGRRFAVANDNRLMIRRTRDARFVLARQIERDGEATLKRQKTVLPELVMR